MQTDGTGTVGDDTPLSMSDAGDALSALLSPESPDTEEGDEATQPAGDEPEQGEVEQDGEQAEAEGDEPADEAEESEVEGEVEQQGTEPTFTVRVDGKDVKVPQSELLAGYSRTSDYTRKTQALAEERKAFTSETQAVAQERSEYAALLPKLRDMIAQQVGQEPDWEALRAQDPGLAAVQKQRWDEAQAKLAKVDAEQARVNQQREQERQAQINQLLIEERGKLLDKLPAWKDEKVAGAESEAVRDVLKSVGFNDDELALYDHRAILIARMAAKYAALEAKKPNLKQRTSAAKVVQPNGGQKRVANPVASQLSRLDKSGSVKDAAKLFESLF